MRNRYNNVRSKVTDKILVDKVVELIYLDIWVDFIDNFIKKLEGFYNKFIRMIYFV